MKTLVLSHQASKILSESLLGIQDQDLLIENLCNTFEFLSRPNFRKTQLIPLKVDLLHIVLNVEIRPTAILIIEVHILGEKC